MVDAGARRAKPGGPSGHPIAVTTVRDSPGAAARPGSRVVVVGAGVGGIAASIALAARGARVTLLERASTVGGKAREVAVGGARIDSGPTVLTMRHVFDAVFEAVGERLDDRVTLRRAEVLARHAWDGDARLDLYADPARTADAIGRFAGPLDAEGYRRFCADTRRLHDVVEGPFLRSGKPTLASVLREHGVGAFASIARIDAWRSMWRSLGDYFRDPRLRQLFGRYATYAGSSPWKCPATLNVIAHVEREGVWYVEGGMFRLVEALRGAAERAGVTVRCDAHVEGIDTRDGRATGVSLRSGERIAADAVVVNADTAALSDGRFGAAASRAWPRAPSEERSLSAVTLSAVARAEGFPLVRHNVFFSRDYEAEFDDLFARERLPAEPTVYVCAHDRGDEGVAPTVGAERLLLLVNAPARGGRNPFSTAEIEECTRRTRDRLRDLGLTLDWSMGDAVTTTPDDFERMFPSTGGALYGPASHGAMSMRAKAPAASKVPGIFLAGGSAHPGAGLPMVARSGLLAAESALAYLASTSRSRPAATHGGTSTP